MQNLQTSRDASTYGVLAYGRQLVVRALTPADRALLARGFALLSPESRYQRYFTPKQALSEEELRGLTESDGEHTLALGLVGVDAQGAEQPLGVARYVRSLSEPDVAEAAVTVIDCVQRKGLGRLLLQELVVEARARGIQRFRCHVLTGNAAAHRLIYAIDPAARVRARDPGSEQYEFLLSPLTPPVQ